MTLCQSALSVFFQGARRLLIDGLTRFAKLTCMCQPDSSVAPFASDLFSVVCLCAEWCGTCRDYREGFDLLASDFAGVRFLWLDIEDQADLLGDLDVENFPTILIRRGAWILFFGTLLPQVGHLRRLIETFVEQTPEQSKAYALSSPERSAWQEDPDLAGIGIA